MSDWIDTSKPAPGKWRMPNDSERRTRIYIDPPFRDCTTLAEFSPDLEEYTDASMRLCCAAPEMAQALKRLVDLLEPRLPDGTLVGPSGNNNLIAAKAALKKAGIL